MEKVYRLAGITIICSLSPKGEKRLPQLKSLQRFRDLLQHSATPGCLECQRILNFGMPTLRHINSLQANNLRNDTFRPETTGRVL
jgi:hypothetical protein